MYNEGTAMYAQIIQALLHRGSACQNPDALVDADEAAAILRMKTQTLANWRCSGKHGLAYTRLGRQVRYRVRDLLEFAEKNRITPAPKEAVAK